MDIKLHNIQVLKDATFKFPETGLVEFVGDNSNGKSVLERAITTIVTSDIEDEDSRKALISDGETSGYVIMVKGDKSLAVQIDHVRDKTVFQYSPNINDKTKTITRTLREGGYKELVYEFGFRVYDRGALCLQVYPTFGHMPFINTSYATNGEIMEDVTKDRVADSFLENYSKVTYPLAQQTIKALKQNKNVLEAQISSTRAYDYVKYEALAERLKRCKEFFEHFVRVHLEELQIPRSINVVSVPRMNLDELKVLRLIDDDMRIDDLSENLQKLHDLADKKCPMCGRHFIEGGLCHNE